MPTSKKALITGITGQDGSYLAEFLLDKGYHVFGFVRRASTDSLVRMPGHTQKKIKFFHGSLHDAEAIANAIGEIQPDEIYNLAAQSDVGVSFKCPEETMDINYRGVGRLVKAALEINPKIKIYQASTSEMFGRTHPPQNEHSPFDPVSPYGESKLKAHQEYVVRERDTHGLFICSGFLFNHESPRRGINFVSRKITRSMAKIKLGIEDSFELGNLEAKRDWGFAGDYVKAMWMMLRQDKPEDFVIATGKSHSVRDFVEATAQVLEMPIRWSGKGLDEVGKDTNGRVILKINKEFHRPAEVEYLLGDFSKAKKILGWEPKVTFDELVAMMARADLEDLRSSG